MIVYLESIIYQCKKVWECNILFYAIQLRIANAQKKFQMYKNINNFKCTNQTIYILILIIFSINRMYEYNQIDRGVAVYCISQSAGVSGRNFY